MRSRIPRQEWQRVAHSVRKKPLRAQEGNHTNTNRENSNTACYTRNDKQTGNHDRRYQFSKDTGPKIQGGKDIKLISINMRSMCEISKREQLVEYMKKRDIDVAAMQETHFPSSKGKEESIYSTVLYECNSRKRKMGSRLVLQRNS